MYFFDAFYCVIYSIIRKKITNFITYKQGVILCCNAVLMSL